MFNFKYRITIPVPKFVFISLSVVYIYIIGKPKAHFLVFYRTEMYIYEQLMRLFKEAAQVFGRIKV